MNRIYQESILAELEDMNEGVLMEGISVTSSSPKTIDTNLHRHIDKIWDDIRSIFKLLDKVGNGVVKNSKDLQVAKVAILASTLELRRQIKHNQKDLSQLRKFLEREVKGLREEKKELLKEIKEFKKMFDLFINPPAAMGPTSRTTGKPLGGIEDMIRNAIKDTLTKEGEVAKMIKKVMDSDKRS